MVSSLRCEITLVIAFADTKVRVVATRLIQPTYVSLRNSELAWTEDRLEEGEEEARHDILLGKGRNIMRPFVR